MYNCFVSFQLHVPRMFQVTTFCGSLDLFVMMSKRVWERGRGVRFGGRMRAGSVLGTVTNQDILRERADQRISSVELLIGLYLTWM